MDKEHNGPADQYMHAMSDGTTGESAAAAAQEMNEFISWNLEDAKKNLREDGSFSDLSLLRLGNIMHTIQDWTCRMHTKNGLPLPWYGMLDFRSAFHPFGENSPSDDWSGIGQAIRLTMILTIVANPAKMANAGLTLANVNKEAEKQITKYVEWWSFDNSGKIGNTQKEAARQCGLGNPAACD